MTRVLSGLCLAAVLFTGGAVAQERHTDRLDSLAQRYRDALLVVRDTVRSVRAATVMFRRDLGSAAPETVIGRASSLRERCSAAIGVLEDREPTFQSGIGSERVQTATDSLIRAMGRLSSELRQECVERFQHEGPGVHADTLRAWGPYRISRIDEAIRRYRAAVGNFARVVSITLPPRFNSD